MRLRYVTLICLLTPLALSGCYRGYASASDLESDERGPSACAQSCQDLGMRMAAFVLVQNDVAGCVCEPAQSAEHRSGATAAVTGGQVVIAARKKAAAQRQQQQQQN